MRVLDIAPRFACHLQPLQCLPGRFKQRPLLAMLWLTRRAQDAASSRAEGQTLTGQCCAAVGAEIKSGAITQLTQKDKLKMRQARAGDDAWLPQVPQGNDRLVKQERMRVVI